MKKKFKFSFAKLLSLGMVIIAGASAVREEVSNQKREAEIEELKNKIAALETAEKNEEEA